MSDFFTLISSYPFIQNAIYAAVLSSVACGIVGTLVVCNRLTFLAGAASHAAYGGIGISMFFGLPLLPCTILFSLAASLFMGWISLVGSKASGKIGVGQPDSRQDAAIGVLWAAGMAFGIILIELSPSHAGELMSFLFGSILTVPNSDLFIMLIFDFSLIVLFLILRQGFWAVSLDYEYSKARGLPVQALFLCIIGLTAVTVVMLIRIVGLILVIALLTMAPSLARQLCNSLYTTMAVAVGFSLFFCFAGLTISWFTDISSGAAIIAFASVFYILFSFTRILFGKNALSQKASIKQALLQR